MRVTLLGHASVLIELSGRAVLVNPVFQDPFGEGMLVACPARQLATNRLPKIDLVVLSDAQPEHFDIATLARLPRDCTVVCPKDTRILYILGQLGFTRVKPTDASAVVKFGDQFEVVTTPSIRKVPEFGVVLKDKTGVFWDPVGTQFSPPIVEQVRRQVGPVHLLLAGYAFPDFNYFGSMRGGFPGPFLRNAVACAQRVAPALVVPGSAGFRFTEPFAWTNAFLFPISQGRFLADLARAAPNLRSAPGMPGDVFEISNGAVERRAGASPIATMIEDDTHQIEFDLAAPVPTLTDPNCDGYSADVLDRQVRATFEELATFVRAAYTTDPVIEEHRRVDGSYGLGVVSPDGSERWLRVQFGAAKPTIEEGRGSVGGALNTTRIAASVLTARARYERGYPYPGGLTRMTAIAPARLVDGKVAVEPREPPELLMHYIRLKPPGWAVHSKKILDFRVAPFLSRGRAR